MRSLSLPVLHFNYSIPPIVVCVRGNQSSLYTFAPASPTVDSLIFLTGTYPVRCSTVTVVLSTLYGCLYFTLTTVSTYCQFMCVCGNRSLRYVFTLPSPTADSMITLPGKLQYRYSSIWRFVRLPVVYQVTTTTTANSCVCGKGLSRYAFTPASPTADSNYSYYYRVRTTAQWYFLRLPVHHFI